jgi:hypothetical protein
MMKHWDDVAGISFCFWMFTGVAGCRAKHESSISGTFLFLGT